jgi:hypothetical protein
MPRTPLMARCLLNPQMRHRVPAEASSDHLTRLGTSFTNTVEIGPAVTGARGLVTIEAASAAWIAAPNVWRGPRHLAWPARHQLMMRRS